MGKIALLVPREEMLYQAHNILQEKQYEIQEMRVVDTDATVVEARMSIAAGASIIIARGLQASLIKQYTDIPVVEIVLTAQEMALLVMRAKQIVKKVKPVIAVVGFRNMFCDMAYFDELYGIELRTYFAKQGNELKHTALLAVEDQVDLIIGGDTAVAVASAHGVPSLFLSMTEDSLRQAFSMAESMDYAMSVEKKSAAQMETLLDYSYNGILRLDAAGKITAVNSVLEDMVGKNLDELKGEDIRRAVPGIEENELKQVLTDGKEYSTFLEWNHVHVFAVMAPVIVEERVDGVIVTCHRMKRRQMPSQKDKDVRGRKDRGLLPLTRFEDILQQSQAMKECVRSARMYAMSDHPVVLRGEAGTEKRMLAESMHNESSRGNGPFLDVPCDGLSGEEQRSMIFGERGAAMQSQGGTLLIQDVEQLTAANQYRLYQLIRFRVCHGAEIGQLHRLDVRVMVTVGRPLACLLTEGVLRQDLYYLLSGLELEVPPLRRRPEDLLRKLENTVRECNERYGRYHVLTNGAKKLLLDYPWEGNLFQIDSFCERLILTAASRSLDEIVVRELLEELYPEEVPVKETVFSDRTMREAVRDPEEEPVENEEAAEIVKLLRRYGGSREKTAKALGISKATLWRHMKKFGIQ